ncbi:MAG TPA: D-alanine--D-alanine ligase [Myxococcota bacterium]|nr:D-alanine--D-alanine ligase [Myxococcota bacterium]
MTDATRAAQDGDPIPDPATVRLAVLASDDRDAPGGDRPDVREVIEAATEIRDALVARGFARATLCLARDLPDIRRMLADDRPDVVFNLIESLKGREGWESAVAALLERSGVAFTGSTALALRTCLDKALCMQVLGRAGVPVPRSEVRTPANAGAPFPFPAFVKPRRTDGSVGIDAGSVVGDPAALAARVRHLCDTFGGEAIVQEYLPGKEINVAVFGDRELTALWPAEIDFTGFPDDVPPIVTYRAKWDEDSREFTGTTSVRARLEPALERAVVRIALHAFRTLGVRDYGRVDMRLGADGRPRVIEVDPNSDLAEGTGIARQAARQGIPHPELVARVARMALARVRRTQESP